MSPEIAHEDMPVILSGDPTGLRGDGHDVGTVRIVDVIVSVMILILLSPFLLLIILAITLESSGPVLVSQTRIGKQSKNKAGKPAGFDSTFQMYRFRITHNSTVSSKRLVERDQMTYVGRVLQMTSLDHLPEFLNVLKGDMSLIGPRPIVAETLNKNDIQTYEVRFDVKPGIIGLWQVSRRHIGNFEEMAKVDLEYLLKRSLLLDLRIFLLTPKAILERNHIQHWMDGSNCPVYENVIYNLIKRLIDIVISLTALIVFSPIMLVIAVIIPLESPGSAIFSQMRAGKRMLLFSRGNISLETTSFRIYKFRTMSSDTAKNDAIHKAWVEQWVNGELTDGSNPQKTVKPKSDPRVTRVGRFLRATSLDELPQFFNILKGDMSLVGPRPVPVYEVEVYKKEHYARLDAPPGLTGLWQIKLRGRGTLDQMIDLDIQYLKQRSLTMDLKILLLTVPAVFTRHGAI